MTKEELDNYLESIGGLESGYFNNRPPILDSYYFEVNKGWYPLIKELIEELIKLGWNKKVTQVKEKFGGLRFYISGGTEEIYNKISEYEKKSYHICEVCGEEGSLRNDRRWLTTLCDKHNINE